MQRANRGNNKHYYNKFDYWHYGGYKYSFNKKYIYDEKEKDFYSNENNVNNIENVQKSDEKGFTGNPDTWFNDGECFKSKTFKLRNDIIRTSCYHDVILNNHDIFKDKVVLDIGCGTGILSIFAAKAGAKHIFGIESADITEYTREIIKKNNLSDKITIIKGKIEEVELPVEKVDIIISEWMGNFLLYGSKIDKIIYARDKWLNKDGYILPDHGTISIAGIENTDYKNNNEKFWEDVYGVDMSCLKSAIIGKPFVGICPPELINSSSCRILDIDLYTIKNEDLDFSSKYEITFFRDNDKFSGLVAWFDIGFTKLTNKFNLTTNPYHKLTYWYQTIFYTRNDLKVNKGDKVTGSFAVKNPKTNFKQLNIKISFNVANKGKNEKEAWHQFYKFF